MNVDYEALQQAERQPKSLRDHTGRWQALTPLAETSGNVREPVEHWAAGKRISTAASEGLGARVRVVKAGAVELAFAGEDGVQAKP